MHVVYFSGASEYTHKFVQKLNTPASRIPLTKQESELLVNCPFILITPTYGNQNTRAVPPQVVRFLNQKQNRDNMLGVIGTGNTNFNADYCKAATIISKKCGVPTLYRVELLGTPHDVQQVKTILGEYKQP